MKLAYATTFDAQDLTYWSGTGYYISEALKKQAIPLQYLGPLRERFGNQVVCKFKRHYHEFFFKRQYLKGFDPLILKSYSAQVSEKLAHSAADLVFSATITPIAYLTCQKPMVFWADATFQNLLNFYPQFTGLCKETIRHGHAMERLAIQKSTLAIYSSDWAAKTAIEYYGADPAKVKVIPFGANIETDKTIQEVEALIESRPNHKCKLLFLGIDWFRKGGDIALAVAKQLNRLGLETELTIVGCEPITDEPLPNFVKLLGFISKSSRTGRERISQLIADSHFLILPSLADCTPIVFCEANSLGVPCISRSVGGIPTVIRDDINGKLFEKEVLSEEYSHYIHHMFTNYSDYKKMALSAYQEYQSRLNWTVAGKAISQLLFSCF